MTEDDLKHIALQITARRELASAALRARDVDAYMSMFSKHLRYIQADGKIIGHDALRRQVEAQFRLLRDSDSHTERESLDCEGSCIIERMSQTTAAAMSVIGPLARTWIVHRKGLYYWTFTEDGWRIHKVEILEEKVDGGALRFVR
jgi:hypothetical protein